MTEIGRRELIAAAAVIGLGAGASGAEAEATTQPRYGLIGKMKAVPGKRQRLVELLLAATNDMPGCLSYVVALDSTDPDGIWITEAWQDEASHKASLSLPAVRAAITEARPLIAGFESSVVTQPIGGTGL